MMPLSISIIYLPTASPESRNILLSGFLLAREANKKHGEEVSSPVFCRNGD
jgi:hypothetical protein